MAELVHEYEHEITAGTGETYRVRAFAEERDNLWVGWLEFEASDGAGTLRTAGETTQPNRDAVAYWASGLEPVYLEGALERAARVR